MVNEKICLTHKIEIRIAKDEKFNSNWNKLRDINNLLYKIYNEAYSMYYSYYQLKNTFNINKNSTNEELDTVRNKFILIYGEMPIKEAGRGRPVSTTNKNGETIKKHFHESGYAEDGVIGAKIRKTLEEKYGYIEISYCTYCYDYKTIKNKDGKYESSCKKFVDIVGNKIKDERKKCLNFGAIQKYQIINNTIIARIVTEVEKTFKDDWYKQGLSYGKRSNRNYRQGIPIPTNVSDITKFKEYQKEGCEHKEYTLTWQGIRFITVNSYKDKNNATYLNSVVNNGSYKFADSSLQIEGSKIYFLLCTTQNKINIDLNKNIIVGVDLGLAIPAYCALNDKNEKRGLSIGNKEDFLRIRTRLQNQRRSLSKNLNGSVSGGHGRGKKLKALEIYEKRERNFVKTYNHFISSQIINYAIKNKAGTIHMEFLEGFGKEAKNSFILRNWSYYELQNMIEYKAKINNIEVFYVDPHHTSQTCSICGNYEKEQRIYQSVFLCKKCGPLFNTTIKGEKIGTTINADFNAARNIAMSNKIVTKKEECEYYKLNKKEELPNITK